MADSQKKCFLNGEGDAWHRRNVPAATTTVLTDPVNLLRELGVKPHCVLEIGCASGFQLVKLSKEFSCDCYGIDPSAEAVAKGNQAHACLNLSVGTADALPFSSGQFDLIVFGFCLYLCDRNDLFTIAQQADRCLSNQGHLVIHDFYPDTAFKNTYEHQPGLYAYKMDYSRMFLWSPSYHLVGSAVSTHHLDLCRAHPNERIATLVLQKNLEFAYPDNPFKTT